MNEHSRPATYAPEDYSTVRDHAVLIGQLSQVLTIEQLEGAITHADRALSLGPILDPTAARAAGDELGKQVRYLRAVLAFRREVEAIREAGDAR
jgi:hypothetical protein